MYAIMVGKLYRKEFMKPWIKCVEEAKGKEALQEAHVSPTGAHEGARALAGKIHRMGI